MKWSISRRIWANKDGTCALSCLVPSVLSITSSCCCLFCFGLVSAVAQDMKLSMRKKEKVI